MKGGRSRVEFRTKSTRSNPSQKLFPSIPNVLADTPSIITKETIITPVRKEKRKTEKRRLGRDTLFRLAENVHENRSKSMSEDMCTYTYRVIKKNENKKKETKHKEKTIRRIHWSFSFPTWVKGFSCCSKQSQCGKNKLFASRAKNSPAWMPRRRYQERQRCFRIEKIWKPTNGIDESWSSDDEFVRQIYIRCRFEEAKSAASRGQRTSLVRTKNVDVEWTNSSLTTNNAIQKFQVNSLWFGTASYGTQLWSLLKFNSVIFLEKKM